MSSKTRPISQKPEHNFARVIAISSGKGGVGKSTLTSNLAIALSNAEKKVCLFDADTNLANINILLGITPTHTLEHFLNDDISINEVITKGPGGIDIICGASGVDNFIQFSHLQQKKLTQALYSLEKKYHYLLIDTAAGINETNINIILAAPYLLLTITREPTSLTDAFSLLRLLKKHHFHGTVLVVVNMVASQQTAQITFKRFKSAVNKYLQLQKLHFAGYILMDKNIPVSILQQQPIILSNPTSPASQCITVVSKRLLSAFTNNQPMSTSFSDYFTDLIFSSDNTEGSDFTPISDSQTLETTPDSSQAQFLTEKLLKKNDLQKGLLRASHYARLLGEKNFNREN